jgi:phenylacetic acid degradation operon negative regulatory protein
VTESGRQADPTDPFDTADPPDRAEIGDNVQIGDGLGLRPLTARSVILSVLLGTHPPLLPVRSLVRTAELFGISEGTARVALSRLVAEGEVVTESGRYRLSERLIVRQHRQDEGRTPVTRPWRGSWEMAVANPDVGGASGRVALGAELARLHLAELRSGVWLRPANLRREWPDSVARRTWRFEARPAGRPGGARALAAGLWALDAWAVRAEALLEARNFDGQPAHRFVVAAAILRHLQEDPLLPASLLPARWPGTRLREAYANYEQELGDLLRRERTRPD